MALHGISRVLSKRGYCSRAEAITLVREGRVAVGGRVIRDPEFRLRVDHPGITVDGKPIGRGEEKVYVMLNKPRGLVTTVSDELGRDTVYSCLEGSGLPRLVSVGRLDKASEGLLLFTNNTAWADHLTAPDSHVPKVYHVQVKPAPEPGDLERMVAGVKDKTGETLSASKVTLLRSGGITAWLEVTLTEGKNRQIRRLAETMGWETQRLIRIAIGTLSLGELPKGQWRRLTVEETRDLGGD